MKAYGFDISNKLIADCWRTVKRTINSRSVMKYLEKRGIPHYDNGNWVSQTAASRIIQRWKKEKKIRWEYGGGHNAYFKRVQNKKSAIPKPETPEMTKAQRDYLSSVTCGILERYEELEENMKSLEIPKKQFKKMSKAFDLIFEVNQSCFPAKKTR